MLGRNKEDLVESGSVWDWLPTVLAFLAIYTALFIFFKPNLLFSLTTTAGGDTGRPPLSRPVPHPGTAAALPPDRLGAGLVRGHAHAHLLLPLPLPAHRHPGLVHPLRGRLQDRHGAGGLRSAGDGLRPGQAVAGAQAVPHHGRDLRPRASCSWRATPSTAATSSAPWRASSATCSASLWCSCSWAPCTGAWRSRSSTCSSCSTA